MASIVARPDSIETPAPNRAPSLSRRFWRPRAHPAAVRPPDSATAEDSDNESHKRTRRVVIMAGFAAGLLLGGLLGLILMPVDWALLIPFAAQPANTRAFVGRVAENYWRSQNTSQAAKDLAGWNREELSAMLADMQRETSDPQAQQHLVALSRALHLSPPRPSLMTLLVHEPVFVFGLVFALAPLFAALGLVGAPLLVKRKKLTPKELAEEEAQALAMAQEAAGGAILDTKGLEGLAKPDEEGADNAKAPGAEEEEEEQEEQEQEDDAVGENEEGGGTDIGDLANLFEEEDTSLSALENLSKSLVELNVDDLLATTKETLQKLAAARSQRRR